MMNVPSDTFFSASPHWDWLIVLYFFFGGIAGGSFFLAAVIDLIGNVRDRAIARAGYLIALPLLVICGALLLVDLGRPARFWHLLIQSNTFMPMFKSWSPMSIGSWTLLAFGVFALLAFVAALGKGGRPQWRFASLLRPPRVAGIVIAIVGALLGLYLAGYTGVMLSVSNRPVWADSPLIGMLFIVSGVSTAAAALMLATPECRSERGRFALHRLEISLLALEFLVLIALVVSLGSVARVWLSGWGALLFVGVVIVGIALPILLYRRGDRFRRMPTSVAAALVLCGGLVLRAVILLSQNSLQVV